MSSAAGFQFNNSRGIVMLVIGLALFGVQDVLVKMLSGEIAVMEVVFFRSPIALIIAWWIVKREGGLPMLRTRNIKLITLRGLIGLSCYTSYYMALAMLPLADVIVIAFSAPLFVAALAAPILGERLDLLRSLAVLVGFVGVIITMNPTGITDPAVLLAVYAAVSYAVQSILTRQLGNTESGGSLAFWHLLIFWLGSCLAGLILGSGWLLSPDSHPSVAFLLRAWTIPTLAQAQWLLIIGLIAGCGFYLLSQAYRIGQASSVAPFEFSAIIWGVLWGFVFWNQLPPAHMWVGMSLILASGFYLLAYEKKLSKAAKLAARKYQQPTVT